jgi:hypothetical protein
VKKTDGSFEKEMPDVQKLMAKEISSCCSKERISEESNKKMQGMSK